MSLVSLVCVILWVVLGWRDVQAGECIEANFWTEGFQPPGFEAKVTAWSDWYAMGVTVTHLVVRAAGVCRSWFGRLLLAIRGPCIILALTSAGVKQARRWGP